MGLHSLKVRFDTTYTQSEACCFSECGTTAELYALSCERYGGGCTHLPIAETEAADVERAEKLV